jgi:uncharacterized protein (TIGR00730 family)
MADLADAFVALPGGFGTLEEFCEMLTWTQIGIHTKPCGLLNIAGYFDQILSAFDHFASEGFILPAHRRLILTEAEPTTLLDSLNDTLRTDSQLCDCC